MAKKEHDKVNDKRKQDKSIRFPGNIKGWDCGGSPLVVGATALPLVIL